MNNHVLQLDRERLRPAVVTMAALTIDTGRATESYTHAELESHAKTPFKACEYLPKISY